MDSIEFNDLYEFLYAMKYGAELDEAAYQGGIPKAEFEDVIQTYFEISTEELEPVSYTHLPQASPTFPELCCHSEEDMVVMSERELVSFKTTEEDRKLQREERCV